MMPTVAPTKDPTAAITRAGPPRPCLAIWKPSSVVATDDGSPGTLSRTAVIVPPYMEP